MKRRFTALAAGLLVVPLSLGGQEPECTLESHWVMEDRGWDIEMVSTGDRWHGSIIDSRDPEVKPGSAVFQDLSWDLEEERFSGTMIRPDSGREVSVQLACVDENTLEVTARIAFIRRSFLLRRTAREREGTVLSIRRQPRVAPAIAPVGSGAPR
jgi:hypothetical protein